LAIALAIFCFADDSVHTGEGTYYTNSGGGSCSFPIPAGTQIAAMNAIDYNGSAACGGLIEVTNEDTGLSVRVRIDDSCPVCAKGDVDLNQSAFAQISDLAAGRIPIHWRYVANDQAGNIKLYFKDGSNQWWFGVQARDHMYPISAIAYRVSGSGSGFVDMVRQDDNYFIGGGDVAGPYDFRITDLWGQTVEATGIPLILMTETDTGKQFPAHETNATNAVNLVPGLYLLLE